MTKCDRVKRPLLLRQPRCLVALCLSVAPPGVSGLVFLFRHPPRSLAGSQEPVKRHWELTLRVLRLQGHSPLLTLHAKSRYSNAGYFRQKTRKGHQGSNAVLSVCLQSQRTARTNRKAHKTWEEQNFFL